MNSDLMYIAEQIKRFRKERHISQEQLAKMVFVSRHTISNIERGKTAITLEVLIAIVEALEVSIADIFPQRLSFDSGRSSAMFHISHEFEKIPNEKKSITEQAVLSVIRAVNS